LGHWGGNKSSTQLPKVKRCDGSLTIEIQKLLKRRKKRSWGGGLNAATLTLGHMKMHFGTAPTAVGTGCSLRFFSMPPASAAEIKGHLVWKCLKNPNKTNFG